MKPIKVFFNGKPMRDLYPHATRWQVLKYRVRMFFRKLVLVGMALTALYVAGFAGATFFPNAVYSIQEVPVKDNTPTAVLMRIAGCESHGKHLNKHGQVLMVPNTNGTVDTGKYQINSVWHAKATELGLDITDEVDNEQMALWIYENRGTEDWYSSKKCWQK